MPSFRKNTVATDYFQQFAIQFSGLADGDHNFAFEIGDQFFSGLEYSIVEGGDVKVDVLLHKQPNMMTLNFDFEGEVKVVCDRCAGSVPYPVEGSQRLIIQLGDGEADDDELIILPRGEFEFNISQHLYEYIALSLPLRLVPCEETDDTSMCDQTVLSRLNDIIVPEESSPADPRWDKLKGLTDIDN